MIFKKKAGEVSVDDVITLGEDSFEVVSQYKYLGHILQNTMSDVEDV